MAKKTARDRVWTVTLNRVLQKGDSITAEFVAKQANVSERTARDCLKTIANERFVREAKTSNGVVRYLSMDDLFVEHS